MGAGNDVDRGMGTVIRSGSTFTSVNSNGRGKYTAFFRPPSGEVFFLYCGADRNDAELAAATMKAEWLRQEIEKLGGEDVMRELMTMYFE